MTPAGRRLRGPLEIAATRIACRRVPAWPRAKLLRRVDQIATLGRFFSPGLRRIAAANLELALGATLPIAQRDEILRRAFRQFALALLDTLWFSRDGAARLDEWFAWPAEVDAALPPGPQILVTGHFGNWELLGQMLARRGRSVMSVAMPLANPTVDRLLLDIRRRSGQIIVPRAGAVRQLLRQLRGGGKVALLLDQNTKPDEGGVYVDFFGRPVPVSQAAAMLALQTGAPILVGFCRMDETGRYRPWVAGELRPGADRAAARDPAAVRALTTRIAALTEQAVRAHPADWLWMYKRWKYVPPGADRAAYPYYARGNGC